MGNASRYTVSVQDFSGSWWTPRVADVGFSWITQGCTAARFRMLDRIASLAPDCDVRISDATGATLWTGQVGVPDLDGTVMCTGNLDRLARAEYPMPVRVTRPSAWVQDWRFSSMHDSIAQAGTLPESDTAAIMMQFPQGADIAANARVRMRFAPFEDAAWEWGAFRHTVKAGADSIVWHFRIHTGLANLGLFPLADLDASQSAITRQVVTNGSSTRPYGDSLLSVEWRYDGSPSFVADNRWVAAYNLAVEAGRFTLVGTRQTLNPALGGVKASDALEHILYSHALGAIDPAASSIAATPSYIPTIDFSDSPTSPREALDYLFELWEPDYLWQLGTAHRAGRAPVEVRAWGTQPRYVVPTHPAVAVSEPGGEADLCDRVTVDYTIAGVHRTVKVIANRDEFPELVGLPAEGRAAPTVSIGEATQATATTVAALVLAQVAQLPDVATIECAPDVPIVDTVDQAVTSADRVRPGWPVTFSLPSGEVVTRRLTAVDTDEGVTRLTVGRPRRTDTQLLRDALKQRRPRR